MVTSNQQDECKQHKIITTNKRLWDFILFGFLVDYRIWQNKYMRWMKTVIDGKQGIDKRVITKPIVTTIALMTT